MNIIKLLERVRASYPHPFNTEEMIDFCNDLGSLLVKNYCEEFESIKLKNGEQLPEKVQREDILRVVSGGRVLERDDINENILFVYPDSKRLCIEIPEAENEVTVTYRKPYEPIRYLSFDDAVTLLDGAISLTKEWDIRPGDILTSGNETFNVESVEVKDDEFLVYGSGDFTQGERHIKRLIDDVTVIDEPYDTLYIDYLISCVARAQKDYETENRSLASFNAKIEDYQRFLIRNGKTNKTTEFYNFW